MLCIECKSQREFTRSAEVVECQPVRGLIMLQITNRDDVSKRSIFIDIFTSILVSLFLFLFTDLRFYVISTIEVYETINYTPLKPFFKLT